MGFDKALLVTGAGGQLGLAFADLVPDAILLDRDALDITSRDAVMDAVRTHRPDVIVNSAAFTKVDQAEAERDKAMLVNAEAVRHLAGGADEVGAILVQPSTDYVFDGDKETPYSEDDPTGPGSVYGVSKLAGERHAANAKRHLIVRTSWVFGEGRNFIRTILKAADDLDELSVVDDQKGLPTYAVDLATGIIGLLDVGADGLFHLAGGEEPATWADLAEHAISVSGKASKVKRVTTEEFLSTRASPVAPRPKNSVLDCSKARALGVSLPDWREAVSRYLTEARLTQTSSPDE
ncbi:MAG: dTDP-4-dehydrorhamnose reductase [Actinobacteria bacterium]|nr:dTDP-4-dehydrorhamnose reductase [Actinomycetota bacterium]